MPTVMLSDQEWQSVVQILGNALAPWVVTHPLLTKISQQLQARPAAAQPGTAMKGEEREAGEADTMPPHMNG